MESLTTRGAQTVMIATLSPTATDIEHSISTLRTVCMLGGSEHLMVEQKEELSTQAPPPSNAVPPGKWSPEEVQTWLSRVDGGRYRNYVDALPRGIDGKQITRWNLAMFTRLCGDKEPVGQKVYRALRNEMERVGQIQKQRRADKRARAGF